MEKVNFGQYIAATAGRFPHKTALVFEGRELTYGAFDERADRLAAALIARGVARQDRVGLLCHNCNEYLEVVVACTKIGAICTQYNWRFSGRELDALLAHSKPVVLFFSARFPELYEDVCERQGGPLDIISVDGSLPGAGKYETLLESPPLPPEEWRGGGEDILLQLYTSGTTGDPKGVMLSHRAVLMHALCNIVDCGWNHNEVFLCILPLFHASSSGTYNSLLVGATVVVHERFRDEAYLESLQKYRGSRLSLTPTLIKGLLQNPLLDRYDLSSVESIVYGAAPITPDVLEAAVGRFHWKFYQLYGMTEMSPTIAVLLPGHHFHETPAVQARRLRSVGRVATGVELRVVDESGKGCPPGVQGEILARGDGMMSGYHGLPELSARVMAGGWYHTGDLGYLDAEGFLYVTGRLSDIIITGEENVSAKEVEACIGLLAEDVAEVAVVGVPDEKWGEAVVAAVVLRAGSALTGADVVRHCEAKMARYKRPREVLFCDALPVNATGKVLKKEVVKMFAQQPAGPMGPGPSIRQKGE